MLLTPFIIWILVHEHHWLSFSLLSVLEIRDSFQNQREKCAQTLLVANEYYSDLIL